MPLIAACGGRPPVPDSSCTDCFDVVPDRPGHDGEAGAPVDGRDATPMDTAVDVETAMDADPEAAVDAALDATDARTSSDVPDAGVLVGPCVPVGAPVQPVNEARSVVRPMWVATTSAGFAASYRARIAGVENVYFQPVGADGSVTGATNLSQNVFALVEGGALAFDGTNFGVVYASNSMGSLDVYFARSTPAGTAVGTPQRVSNDPQLSELAQVAPRTGGWMAVWRSTDDTMGTVALISQALDPAGAIVGTPNTLTAAGVAPGSFRLVSSTAHLAVVYVDQQPLSGNVYALDLSAAGAAIGTPTELSAGALSTDGVSAVLTGTQLTAAWTDAGSSGVLHLRQRDVASGTTGAIHNVSSIGMNVSKVGLASDGAGFAVAMRVPWMSGGSTAMVRFDASLTPRDALSRVGDSGLGDRVDIAARGDGTYLVGWADATPTLTTGTLQVMRCP